MLRELQHVNVEKDIIGWQTKCQQVLSKTKYSLLFKPLLVGYSIEYLLNSTF
jgi:hypothetical protein